MRDLKGDRVEKYFPFSVDTFPEMTEEPAYFKKEVRPSEQMSALELRRYIASSARADLTWSASPSSFTESSLIPLSPSS